MAQRGCAKEKQGCAERKIAQQGCAEKKKAQRGCAEKKRAQQVSTEEKKVQQGCAKKKRRRIAGGKRGERCKKCGEHGVRRAGGQKKCKLTCKGRKTRDKKVHRAPEARRREPDPLLAATKGEKDFPKRWFHCPKGQKKERPRKGGRPKTSLERDVNDKATERDQEK